MALNILISDLELQARAILDDARRTTDWSPALIAVTNTFRACWSDARDADNLCKLSDALHGEFVREEGFKRMLSKLVRSKHLRTRQAAGKHLYEINLKTTGETA